MIGPFDIGAYWLVDLLLIGKIAIAATLGVLIGYERSYHGRAAGMRTYALVAMGACMLLMIHGWPELWFGSVKAANLTDDSTRVIQGIVTGIGFLGAGVIIKDGFSIRGLSTSASIWLTAAVGILVGIGFFAAAIAATLITMVIMSEFRFLEELLPHRVLVRLEMTFKRSDEPTFAGLRARMREHGFAILNWSVKSDFLTDRTIFVLELEGEGRGSDERLAESLSSAPDIVDYLIARERS